MSELRTVVDVFYSAVERNGARVMLYQQGSEWIPISTQELYRNVAGVANSLSAWGITKGDRVALLSENRFEWAVADFACLLIGAVVVPIYQTLTADQTAYVLQDSGARAAFVSTGDQLRKVFSIKKQTAVAKIVVMDDLAINDAVPMHRLMQEGPTARDNQFDTRARQAEADDLATIIYTSGTTGQAKGVMLTHGNLASNVSCSLQEFADVGPSDVTISYLPLSHITARHVDYAFFYRGVTLAYCPRFEDLPQTLAEIRPTLFAGVPRVYEKVRNRVELETAHGTKRNIYEWALRVGESHMPETLAGKRPRSLSWKLANALVFKKICAGMGGRVRGFIAGGAPLGRELAEWWAKIGVRIHEGYGLTETSPVIAVNTPLHHKLGTVGRPLPNVEVKTAPDGELLVRGPSIFKSYWNLPEETAAAFVDGWFKTGDIGHLDEDGYLVITDRKKDLIKTSGGKFIAPQPIENTLKSHVLIAEAAVIGERHKFPAVVIVPNFAALEQWAQDNGVPQLPPEEMVMEERVRALYDGIVGEVNRELAQFEKMKRVLLLAEEFTVANGLLTPSMKLKRKVLHERYQAQIQQMYADAARGAEQEIQASAS